MTSGHEMTSGSATRWHVAFAVAAALLAFNLLSFAFGEAPLSMLHRAFEGTWGTPYGIGQVVFKATPLLLTGLAFHVALRTGLFNIGGEGQLALASLGAAYFGSHLPAMPWPLAATIVVAMAVAIGASYAAIAGYMRARLGVHEIISGIMLNRCADVLLPWLLVTVIGAAHLRTETLDSARLPSLDTWLPSLRGSAASIAFPLAVLAAVLLYRWLDKSPAGREMAWVGLGPEACQAKGIDVARRRMQAMLISGALAGAVMATTVLGYKGHYELGLGAGAGFSGIAVAMVGRGSALGMILAALLFGTLAQAGLAINAQLPKEAMGVLEALVILLAAASALGKHRRPIAQGATS